ncbi:alanine racemase [Zongyangia hominis]|uniref:Alanine racemase n=1 Tax=Zongyangia hominis TaxID=2763677 RepID=A0A926IBT4_9FIRM|nr:alanine racemase [Zongyangia hominis]MBC8570512.1 alanine racemase [Zongyangia hominis]
MCDFLKRSWAEIDLDCISHNVKSIRSLIGPKCKLLGVVKADAYGHGDKKVALQMQEDGVDWFGISNIEEGVGLRQAGIVKPILIFGATPVEYVKTLAKYRITQALFSPEYALELSRAAVEAGVQVDVHVKVDTGMTRIGFVCTDGIQAAADRIAEACALSHLHPTGIFTHFAVSDELSAESQAYTRGQFDKFMAVIAALEERGVTFPLRHCCNSAGVINYPEMHLDMVRPGIICYGLAPSDEMRRAVDLRQAMTLKSVISMVKDIPAGTTVSYGRKFESGRLSKIATVPIGYADGYNRLLGGRAHALVQGRQVPVVGRVCMDQIMLDITDAPGIQAGDEAILLGTDGHGHEISINEVGALCGTIGYEVVCLIGKRVPRVYLKGGKQVGVVDYVQPYEK